MSVNDWGFALDSAKLPLPAGIPAEQARELALYGGGDYELIFTIAPEKFPVPGVQATVIGEVVHTKTATVDGKPLEKRGYQHRWE
jgi:thiamine-monophosphate kinase